MKIEEEFKSPPQAIGTPKIKKPIFKIADILGEKMALIDGMAWTLTKERYAWEIVSLSSKILQKKIEKHPNIQEWLEYNTTRITRSFPGKTFETLSLDPIESWKHGIQIVAEQLSDYADENILINLAKFRENGGVNGGYVLKNIYTERFENKGILHITPLSLSQLPQIPIGEEDVEIYIEIDLMCPTPIPDNTTLQTQVVNTDGFNINFISDTNHFPLSFAVQEAHSFLVVQVKSGDSLVCANAFPVERIREGYRSLPMLDYYGNKYAFVQLLCLIEWGKIPLE